MAFFPFFVLSPSAVLSIIGLMYGGGKTTLSPSEDYRKVTFDLVIPAYNEEKNIVLCLDSIAIQTLKPTHIFLVDDGSTDKTSEYAREFAEFIGIKLTLIRHKKTEGKTSALHMAARDSEADVLFVLDADTILRTENYIERLIQELCQGIDIASACGIVSPQIKGDRERLTSTPTIKKFTEKYPDITGLQGENRFLQSVINTYREELYFFLQQFIYHGEMVFFGTIINPVGCAVAYRREYLKQLLEHYAMTLGNNLTDSEDIFIGFAFDNLGYRNIQVQNVYALTREPRIDRLPKQVISWSSAFFQSCYYFNSLVCTPFKALLVFFHNLKNKMDLKYQKKIKKPKIQEAYRQTFGVEYTKKFGRPIGWFIFTALFEKISFPTILIIFIVLHLWKILVFTLLAEVTVYTFVIAFLHKHNRLKNTLKSILLTPIRYSILLLEVVVIVKFVKDLWITRNREWRK